ncbi:hypothetical protein ACKU5V_027650 [Klebsiella pneumoniae]
MVKAYGRDIFRQFLANMRSNIVLGAAVSVDETLISRRAHSVR